MSNLFKGLKRKKRPFSFRSNNLMKKSIKHNISVAFSMLVFSVIIIIVLNKYNILALLSDIFIDLSTYFVSTLNSLLLLIYNFFYFLIILFSLSTSFILLISSIYRFIRIYKYLKKRRNNYRY